MGDSDPGQDKAAKGRRVAVVLAIVGLYWIGVTWLGEHQGWSNRTRALFDLFALAGFGWALWNIFQIWRHGRQD